jgi:PAS domain S-box-containing protein
MEDELRKKAEKLLGQDPVEIPVLSTVEVQRLFHELNVYQFELQMQNEELRQAQQQLSATRDVYLELYDFAPVGYLTLDPEGRIIDANFTAATQLGFERGKQLVGRTFSSLVHGNSLHAWDTRQQLLAENGERQAIDLVLKRLNGSHLTFRIDYTRRPASGQYLLALTDMTQRVHAEETLKRKEQDLALFNLQLEQRVREGSAALAESEEKYRKLFELESDAIIIFDGKTRQFIDVNAAALGLYGYTGREFLQLTHSAISAEPELAKEIIPAALPGEHIPAFLSHHRKKDGTVFPAEITGFSFSWQGRLVICAVIRDIGERVAYEKELHDNREELKRLASELSLAEQRERERMGRELHDGISQLLNSAYIHLNVLKDSELPKVTAESLDTICGIVKQTLDETRSLTFELSCPMLNELGLAAALQELCSSLSHEYVTRFKFHGAMERVPLSLDRTFVLYRSARELLINVMKHAEAESASVKIERVAGEVRICVKDDGKGFEAAKDAMGFSPTGGFGLFNISENIGRAGGTLQIESAPGEGTEVVLTMPLEKQHE